MDDNQKKLGVISLAALVVGAMIGGGIFSLPQNMAQGASVAAVIAAWIISHEHWDHFENFYNFCNTYSSKIVLEQVVYNVARTSINYNSNNPGGYVKNGNGNLKGMSIQFKCKLTKRTLALFSEVICTFGAEAARHVSLNVDLNPSSL